jgi:DNA-binding CsgD family transcriptional regulator
LEGKDMGRSFLDSEYKIILRISILDDQICLKNLHVESIQNQKIEEHLGKIAHSEFDQIKENLPDLFQHILQTNIAFRKEILTIVNSYSNPVSISGDKYHLTIREKEVLKLLTEGHTKKEISKILFVSHNTIGTHINHIYHKLNVKNRGSAVAKTLVEELLQ